MIKKIEKVTTKTLQVQRENLEKENNALKADLEQMHGLQEQYEHLQEKVSLQRIFCKSLNMQHLSLFRRGQQLKMSTRLLIDWKKILPSEC